MSILPTLCNCGKIWNSWYLESMETISHLDKPFSSFPFSRSWWDFEQRTLTWIDNDTTDREAPSLREEKKWKVPEGSFSFCSRYVTSSPPFYLQPLKYPLRLSLPFKPVKPCQATELACIFLLREFLTFHAADKINVTVFLLYNFIRLETKNFSLLFGVNISKQFMFSNVYNGPYRVFNSRFNLFDSKVFLEWNSFT